MATDYGADFSCGSDLDPLLRLVTGEELMAQVCLHRVFCRQGSLLSNPVDNTIDLRDQIATGIEQKDLAQINGKARSALMGDQRIFTATVSSTFVARTNTLTLSIQGDGAFGPFNLTLAADAVTVEILRNQ
jgi:hypothetical protein